VFTAGPLAGNPVAVVFDADDLGTEAMQAIAGWTNLSETTFELTPTMPAAATTACASSAAQRATLCRS